MSKTIAIMTAREGSESVKDKNKLPMPDGQFMFLNNLRAACSCSAIDEVYVTTDILETNLFSEYYGYHVIERPEALRGNEASHYDVMRHAVDIISEEHKFTKLVLLLGNSSGCSGDILEEACEKLDSNPDADSIMSVGKFNQFNVFRAFKKSTPAQYLTTCVEQRFIPPGQANDKNVDGNVYFFNGSFWIVRKDAFLKNNGIRPYTWLGRRIMHYHQTEYIQEIDSYWQYDLVTRFSNRD